MFDRRRFLTATAAAAAAGFLPEKSQILKAMPAAESEFGKVKVTDVKTASVMIKYPAHLVKVETDSGLYGIGEAFNRDGVLDHIRHHKETVIGQDPLQVDYLYQRMAELKLGHGSWTGTINWRWPARTTTGAWRRSSGEATRSTGTPRCSRSRTFRPMFLLSSDDTPLGRRSTSRAGGAATTRSDHTPDPGQ